MAKETTEKKTNNLIGKNDASANLTIETSEQYNIFRESPLRYLGYANEVGESFRYQVDKKEILVRIYLF